MPNNLEEKHAVTENTELKQERYCNPFVMQMLLISRAGPCFVQPVIKLYRKAKGAPSAITGAGSIWLMFCKEFHGEKNVKQVSEGFLSLNLVIMLLHISLWNPWLNGYYFIPVHLLQCISITLILVIDFWQPYYSLSNLIKKITIVQNYSIKHMGGIEIIKNCYHKKLNLCIFN